MKDSLDEKQFSLLEKTLVYIEDNFPVNALYLDATKGDISQNKEKVEEDSEIEQLYNDVLMQIEFGKEYGMSKKEIIKLFMISEPYCNYKRLMVKLEGMLNDE